VRRKIRFWGLHELFNAIVLRADISTLSSGCDTYAFLLAFEFICACEGINKADGAGVGNICGKVLAISELPIPLEYGVKLFVL